MASAGGRMLPRPNFMPTSSGGNVVGQNAGSANGGLPRPGTTGQYPWEVGSPVPGPNEPGFDERSFLSPGTATPSGNVFNPHTAASSGQWNMFDRPDGGQFYTPNVPQAYVPGSLDRNGRYNTPRYSPDPMYSVYNTQGGQGGMFYGGADFDNNGFYRPVYTNQTSNYDPWAENANYDPRDYGISGQ